MPLFICTKLDVLFMEEENFLKDKPNIHQDRVRPLTKRPTRKYHIPNQGFSDKEIGQMSKRLRKQVFKLLKLKSRGEKVFPNIYPTRLWLNSSQPDKGRLPSKEALKMSNISNLWIENGPRFEIHPFCCGMSSLKEMARPWSGKEWVNLGQIKRWSTNPIQKSGLPFPSQINETG